jgi:hypothetical protein
LAAERSRFAIDYFCDRRYRSNCPLGRWSIILRGRERRRSCCRSCPARRRSFITICGAGKNKRQFELTHCHYSSKGFFIKYRRRGPTNYSSSKTLEPTAQLRIFNDLGNFTRAGTLSILSPAGHNSLDMRTVGSLCPEPLLRPHPKRHDRSNQQDRNAAEKRKSPVPCLVDHVSEHHWRNDGGERRTDIHEAARGA